MVYRHTLPGNYGLLKAKKVKKTLTYQKNKKQRFDLRLQKTEITKESSQQRNQPADLEHALDIEIKGTTKGTINIR